MRFLVKTIGKKAIAVICTFALLLSVMSVCFGAFASDATTVYTVDASKSAIPATQGSVIDLSKIAVEFDADTTTVGSDLNWSTTDTSGGVIIDNTAKTITLLGGDIYAVAATDGTNTKDIYVFAPASDNTKVIYQHTFSEADVDTTTKDFVDDSDWMLRSTSAGKGQLVWNTVGGVQTGNSLYCGYALKPTSEGGKLVSAFRDVILEANIAFSTNFGAADKSYQFNLLGRVTWKDNDPTVGLDTYAGAAYNGLGGQATDWARLNVSGITNLYDFPNKNTAQNTFYNYRINLIGNDVKIAKNGTETPISLTEEQLAKIADTKGGTISLSDYNTRLIFKDIKVTAVLSAEDVAAMAEYCSAITLIKAGKPAIPMAQATKLNLNDIFVEFDDGSVKQGKDITWATTDTTGGLLVDDTAKTVALMGDDMYVLTATAGEKVQTLYVLIPDADNTKTIFDYTFTAADVGLAVNDANGKPIWSYSGAGSWGWVDNKNLGTSQPRLRNDGGAGVIYLNPESEDGKVVSSFADYTFYLTAVTHENWVANGKYFPMLTRYTMAGESFNLAADTYLGYRAYFGSNGGGVFVGNSLVSSATKTWSYNASAPHVDFKMEVSGAELIFSAKPFNVATYTEIYKMSEAGSVPAAVTATVGKAGTIGVYTDTNNRPSLQKAKVVLTFTGAELDAIAKYCEDIDVTVIDPAKPAVPAKVGFGIDLTKLAVVTESGVVFGEDITWSTTDTTGGLVVDDTAKTAIYAKEGAYELIATVGGVSTTLYVLESENGVATVYDHTFTASDITYDNTEHGEFTAASEWKAHNFGRPGYTNVVVGLRFMSGGIVVTDTAGSGYASAALYLDPDSASGKRVAAFPDMTLLIKANSAQGSGTGEWVGPYLHLNLGTDGAVDATAKYSSPRFIERAGTGFLRNYYANGTTTGQSDLAAAAGTPLTGSKAFALRYTINGNSITAESDIDNAGTFDALTKTYTDNNLPASGTIGLYSVFNLRPVFSKVTVTTEVDDTKAHANEGGYLFEIVQAEKPVADTTEFTYNGEDQTYAIAENAAYTVTGNVQKNAGEYTVTVALKDKSRAMWTDGTTDDLTFDFVIAKKAVTVTANDKSIEKDAAEPTLDYVAEGLVEGETLTGALTREPGTSVGTYAIEQGTVTNENNPNYVITFVGAEFKITKTNQAALNITGQPTGDIVYGDNFTLGATGGTTNGAINWEVTEGAAYATVDNNGKVTVTGVGAVKVTATMAGNNDYEPVSATYEFTSIKATPVIGTVAVSGTVKDTTAPSEVVLTKQSGPEGTLRITDAAMLKTQTTYNWEFIPTDAANYNRVTGTVTINVLETVAPTATIKLDGASINISGEIVFDILKDEEIEIAIEYADEANGSGLDDTLYCVANKALSAEELATAQWTAYNGAFKLSSDGKFVIYAKATDNDGNVTVVASKGIAIDTVAPVITGAEDGETYYGDTEITVSDATSGVKEVKVDGEAVTLTNGKFTVKGDGEDHTITVTDMLGNVTEIEITVNKLYTVTFMDGDTVYATVKVKDGEKVTMPEAPKKDGYTSAWEKTVETVTEDTVIKVVYTAIPKEDAPAGPEAPKTNDARNIWLWAAALVVSAGSLFVVLFSKKSKEN